MNLDCSFCRNDAGEHFVEFDRTRYPLCDGCFGVPGAQMGATRLEYHGLCDGRYDAQSAPCEGCGADEVTCLHRSKRLCQSCWHRARYAEDPYVAIDDRCLVFGQSSCLLEEAELHVAALNDVERRKRAYYRMEASRYPDDGRTGYHARARSPLIVWRVERAKEWFGDRIAHPGYLDSRRRALGFAPLGTA